MRHAAADTLSIASDHVHGFPRSCSSMGKTARGSPTICHQLTPPCLHQPSSHHEFILLCWPVCICIYVWLAHMPWFACKYPQQLMAAAGRAFVCVDSVTGFNLEPMCKLVLPVDCYLCLHAMVLVKIKLGWLTAISSRPKLAQCSPDCEYA